MLAGVAEEIRREVKRSYNQWITGILKSTADVRAKEVEALKSTADARAKEVEALKSSIRGKQQQLIAKATEYVTLAEQ